MALLNLRNVFKLCQAASEPILLNSRMISVTNMIRNTVETEKRETSAQEFPDVKSDKVNPEIEKLNEQIADLTSKNAELTDKYKRALADGENLRIRLTKQISEAKIFGIQSFCKDMLDVADVLNKATETVPKEEINDKNPHLKSLYEGLLLTESQLKSVFKRHGLEPVNPLNEKFNPNYHEALFQQDVQGKEPGTVVVVSKIGYKLQDRVIRPALVGVAK